MSGTILGYVKCKETNLIKSYTDLDQNSYEINGEWCDGRNYVQISSPFADPTKPDHSTVAALTFLLMRKQTMKKQVWLAITDGQRLNISVVSARKVAPMKIIRRELFMWRSWRSWALVKQRNKGDRFRPVVTTIKQKKGVPTVVEFSGKRYTMTNESHLRGNQERNRRKY